MARVVLQQSPSGDNRFFLGKDFLWHWAFSIVIILVYFALSISLTFYQQWFLQIFKHPPLVVMCHLLIKFLVAAMCRSLWQCWNGKQRVRVNWPNLIRKVVPMGFVSGIDIAFSNWGLELITVSLYTMTKSTSIIFILFFALLFKLEEKSWSLFLIVVMISGGLAMFTYKALQFDVLGFFLVLFASFTSGLRWTLAQFLMQKTELGLDNPIDMLYHVQPWMFISTFPIAIAFEVTHMSHNWGGFTSPADWDFIMLTGIRIVWGALIALAMELTEYLVISRMSSLTLSVAGIFKEVCTLTLAVMLNGDKMSQVNVVGLLLCLGGIMCHVGHKASRAANPTQPRHKPLLDEASAHFLADASTSTDDDEPREDSSTEVLFSVLHSRDRKRC